MSGLEVLAYSFNTDVNYVTTMLQLHLSLKSLSKVMATFRREMQQLLGVFSKIDT